MSVPTLSPYGQTLWNAAPPWPGAPTTPTFPSNQSQFATPTGTTPTTSSPVTPQPAKEPWGVFTEAGMKVFDVDSCINMKINHDAKISTFPVELGAFTAYNKVVEPMKCKIQLAVAGHVRMSALITALEAETAAVNIYDIYTPEYIYFSMTLEKASYPRSLEKGRNVILAELEFVEVKQVSPQYAAIKNPVKPKHTSKAVTGRLPPLNTLDYAMQTPQERLNGPGYSYQLNQTTVNNTFSTSAWG